MKKSLFISAAIAMAAMQSCASRPGDGKAAQAAPDEMPQPEATAPEADTVPVLQVEEFEKSKGENKLEIEYPVGGGNAALLSAIRTWINEELGDTYSGPLDDGKALFKHYAALLGTDPDLNEYGGFTINEFDLEYQNAEFVTYSQTTQIYSGGAHGEGGEYGTTFLRSDGMIFDKDCISSYTRVMPLIINGLKKYFKVKTDAELLGCLLDVPSLDKLRAPGMKPWIEEDGVVFSYTPYEIAPYSSGSPRAVVPYSEIAPYLTDKGKRFFENQ